MGVGGDWTRTNWAGVPLRMRIVLGYPSLDDPRGFVQVSQNRQSKIFSVGEEAAIFPCVMAWAATLLKQAGHEVLWLDGPTQGLTWDQCRDALVTFQPDLVCWEVKTPSAKRAYQAVNDLKEVLPGTIVVLVGDHVTALPEEAVEATYVKDGVPVVVVLNGDYDYALMEIVRVLTGERSVFLPGGAHLPAYLRLTDCTECRIHYGFIWHQDTTTKLDTLPVIDRELCKWKLYSRMGNYLYRPGTHGYSARDCWWRHEGGCTFCSWTNTFKNYRTMSVDQFMADVESAHALGAREYFDDAGTWAPPGQWFEDACTQLHRFNRGRRHHQARIAFGCNDRPGARGRREYELLAWAGGRFILYGLESANLVTLQRINKGQAAEDMRNAAKWASEAGLQPHLTVMFGYPWETHADAEHTVQLVHELFDRGYANSMQATLLMPYPGTALFREAQANGWLLTEDWNRYTMNECILKCPMSQSEVLEQIRECYRAAVSPRYILKKVLTVRSQDDLRFFWRGFKFWWGHLQDFSPLNSRRP